MLPSWPTRRYASAFDDGSDVVGCLFACLIHAVCTCASVSPALVRVAFTPSQSGCVGDSHESAACPPRAPLTIAIVEWLTAGSAFACPTNDHDVHGPTVFAAQNSCVVFDMPTDTITILPDADGLPSWSSGRTCAACPRPIASWSAGATFVPCS